MTYHLLREPETAIELTPETGVIIWHQAKQGTIIFGEISQNDHTF